MITKNSNLLSIYTIDVIKDEIVYWLMPKDIFNLNIALDYSDGCQELDISTSLIRYIIPNRRWLMHKVKSGYTFTLIGSALRALRDYSVKSITQRKKNTTDLYICLIITKDNNFVTCTEDFADKSIFCRSKQELSIAHDTTFKHVRPHCRSILVNKDSIQINILCPVIDHETTIPINLLSPYYSGCLVSRHDDTLISYHNGHLATYYGVYDDVKYNTAYLHLGSSITEVKEVENSHDSSGMPKYTNSKLFSILHTSIITEDESSIYYSIER